VGLEGVNAFTMDALANPRNHGICQECGCTGILEDCLGGGNLLAAAPAQSDKERFLYRTERRWLKTDMRVSLLKAEAEWPAPLYRPTNFIVITA
jgi:hypothetical protein